MGAASPEAADPQERAEPQIHSSRRSWWRVKVPTSVVLTLVGIVLTAWLLPAFTRQWDDRQKARQLKAELVADMASATADAMIRTSAFEPGTGGSMALRRRAATSWALASVKIEARLRAYFPPDVVAAWQLYSYYLDLRMAGLPIVQRNASLIRALRWMMGTERSPGPHYPAPSIAGSALVTQEITRRLGSVHVSQHEFFSVPTEVLSTADPFDKSYAADIRTGKDPVGDTERQAALLDFEERVADLVVEGHPTGYSTTWRDLVSDLLP